jgi:hypothetical protein
MEKTMKSVTTISIILISLFFAVVANAEQETGRIVAWGLNTSGQLNVPEPNTNFLAVSTGAEQVLGLKSDSTIVAWGRNQHGQGSNPIENHDFVAISAGHAFNMALKFDGSITAWGYNAYGQCNVPAPNTGFVAIAAGGLHALALRSDGSIAAWGQNYGGCTNVPNPNSGFVKIAAGWAHSIGIKEDGTIVIWGYHVNGENGIPTENSGFVDIAGAENYYMALKNDGSLYAWGNNSWGQLDIPNPNEEYTEIDAEGLLSVGKRIDGSIDCWGRFEADTSIPVEAPQDAFGATQIVAGLSCCVALVPDCSSPVEIEFATEPYFYSEPGHSITQPISLTNMSCDKTLTIDSLVIENDIWSSSINQMTMLPSETLQILIDFNPQTNGRFESTIEIYGNTSISNTTDSTITEIALLGYGGPIFPQISDLSIHVDQNLSSVLTWSPITETIYGNPATPDYYLVFYNERNPTDELDWYYHGATSMSNYVHLFAALHATQMTYRVMAYHGLPPAIMGMESGMSMKDVITRITQSVSVNR